MYKLTKRLIKADGKFKLSYGIKSRNERFNNLSCNKKEVEKLCYLCNRYELDEVHLGDVVEDFLVTLSVE